MTIANFDLHNYILIFIIKSRMFACTHSDRNLNLIRPCQRNKIDEKAEQDAALAQLLAEF